MPTSNYRESNHQAGNPRQDTLKGLSWSVGKAMRISRVVPDNRKK
jgi:hypothetical protein